MPRYMILVVCLCSLVMADATTKEATQQPKSPAAKFAIQKAEKSVRDAEDAYRKAVALAYEQEIKDFTEAKKAAMKAENLEEAVAIDQAIREAREALAAGKAPATKKPEALNLEGTYAITLAAGDASRVTLQGGKARHHDNGQVGTYERVGNEVRIRWPTGYVDRYVFGATAFKLEGWAPGKKLGEDKPTHTGVGVRFEEK